MQINKIIISDWFINHFLIKTRIREHHSIARFILQTSLTNFFSFLMMYNLNPVHSIVGWHNIIWWKGWSRKTLMSAYHSILKTSHPHNISAKTLECFVLAFWVLGLKNVELSISSVSLAISVEPRKSCEPPRLISVLSTCRYVLCVLNCWGVYKIGFYDYVPNCWGVFKIKFYSYVPNCWGVYKVMFYNNLPNCWRVFKIKVYSFSPICWGVYKIRFCVPNCWALYKIWCNVPNVEVNYINIYIKPLVYIPNWRGRLLRSGFSFEIA